VGGDGGGGVGEMVAVAQGGDGDHDSSLSVLLSLTVGALVLVTGATPPTAGVVFVGVATPTQICLLTSSPSPGATGSHHLLRFSMLRRWAPQLPSSPPHVGSSHLRERRESTPIFTHERVTLSFPHPHAAFTRHATVTNRRAKTASER
jgi:hypothetical protein